MTTKSVKRTKPAKPLKPSKNAKTVATTKPPIAKLPITKPPIPKPVAKAKPPAKSASPSKPRPLQSGRPASRPKPNAAARSGVKFTAQNPLSTYVDAAIGALSLRVDLRWTPMIALHLQVILQQAALVSAFTLPDEAEPAPIFKA